MKEIIELKIRQLLDKRIEESCQLKFGTPRHRLSLHRKFKRLVVSADGCGGYTGHCSCLNNPCKMCTNLH